VDQDRRRDTEPHDDRGASRTRKRSHLHRVGLAIAATCERSVLELTWGRAPGKALFEQSRDLALAPARITNPYRPAVTLATLGAMAADPDDGETGSTTICGLRSRTENKNKNANAIAQKRVPARRLEACCTKGPKAGSTRVPRAKSSGACAVTTSSPSRPAAHRCCQCALPSALPATAPLRIRFWMKWRSAQRHRSWLMGHHLEANLSVLP
jgi:hypothetical protein